MSTAEIGVLVALISVIVMIGTSGMGQGIRTEFSDTSAVLGSGSTGDENGGRPDSGGVMEREMAIAAAASREAMPE